MPIGKKEFTNDKANSHVVGGKNPVGVASCREAEFCRAIGGESRHEAEVGIEGTAERTTLVLPL